MSEDTSGQEPSPEKGSNLDMSDLTAELDGLCDRYPEEEDHIDLFDETDKKAIVVERTHMSQVGLDEVSAEEQLDGDGELKEQDNPFRVNGGGNLYSVIIKDLVPHGQPVPTIEYEITTHENGVSTASMYSYLDKLMSSPDSAAAIQYERADSPDTRKLGSEMLLKHIKANVEAKKQVREQQKQNGFSAVTQEDINALTSFIESSEPSLRHSGEDE